MKSFFKREFPLLAIVSIPFIYLAYIWNSLPAKVPVHWNLDGEVNRMGDKMELLLVAMLLPLMTYVLFLILPKIDPKKSIEQNGK